MAAYLMVPAEYVSQDPCYALLRLGLQFQLDYEGTIVSEAWNASVQQNESGIQIPWEATVNRDLMKKGLGRAVLCEFFETYGLDSEL